MVFLSLFRDSRFIPNQYLSMFTPFVAFCYLLHWVLYHLLKRWYCHEMIERISLFYISITLYNVVECCTKMALLPAGSNFSQLTVGLIWWRVICYFRQMLRIGFHGKAKNSLSSDPVLLIKITNILQNISITFQSCRYSQYQKVKDQVLSNVYYKAGFWYRNTLQTLLKDTICLTHSRKPLQIIAITNIFNKISLDG